VIVREIFAEKEVNPVVLAFSKDFIVTVAKSEDQGSLTLPRSACTRLRLIHRQLWRSTFWMRLCQITLHLERIEDIAAPFEPRRCLEVQLV